MKRRAFLKHIVAAPFVVTTAGVLMPVRQVDTPGYTKLDSGVYVYTKDVFASFPMDERVRHQLELVEYFRKRIDESMFVSLTT